MIVADASKAANQVVELMLSAETMSGSNYTKLLDLSDKLSGFSTAAGLIYETVGIWREHEALRDEILISSTIQNKSEALRMSDELKYDRMAFNIMITILPIIATGGVMAGPTMLFSGMLGVMGSFSDVFWQMRHD